MVLTEKSATVTAGTAGTVKVRPAKKFRKRFRKKGFRVRVNVEARDQYGNRSIVRKTVKVKKVKAKKKGAARGQAHTNRAEGSPRGPSALGLISCVTQNLRTNCSGLGWQSPHPLLKGRDPWKPVPVRIVLS